MVTTATGLDQAALDRGRQALLRGWSTTVAREANLLLVRAKGTRIWDVDGNEYIDCTSQAWSNNSGAFNVTVSTGTTPPPPPPPTTITQVPALSEMMLALNIAKSDRNGAQG